MVFKLLKGFWRYSMVLHGITVTCSFGVAPRVLELFSGF